MAAAFSAKNISIVYRCVFICFPSVISPLTHNLRQVDLPFLCSIDFGVSARVSLCADFSRHICRQTCATTRANEWHVSLMCVTWFGCACDVTRSCVWHDSCMCVTWFVPACDVPRRYAWHGAFTCETWLVHVCDTEISECAAWGIAISILNTFVICDTHTCLFSMRNWRKLVDMWHDKLIYTQFPIQTWYLIWGGYD